MNSRIKQFMAYKGLSSSELADNIGVQRSNVTHVLNGRNKPSFQFIAKLLEKYPEIDAKWLIMGEGQMLEAGGEQKSANLFSGSNIQEPATEPKRVIEQPQVKSEEPIAYDTTKPVIPQTTDKKIERILVFYTDQTFKEYTPSK